MNETGANIDEVISDLIQCAKDCGEPPPNAEELVEQLKEYGFDVTPEQVGYYL